MMNTEQLGGLLRTLLPVITAALVSLGLDNTTAGLVSAAIVAIAMAIWSYFTNRQESIVAKAAKVPGVNVAVDSSAPEPVKVEAQKNPNITEIK